MASLGTFERVYQAIKQWLRRGEFHAGERLEPGRLSDRLNASVTPVRDALNRLTGERLVDAPPHEGFRVPLASEIMLRQLYAWHRDLVFLAIARRSLDPRAVPSDMRAGEDLVGRQQALFLLLASSSGNLELVDAIRTVIARLAPYQHLEAGLLDSLEEETSAIAKALERGDRATLRRLLYSYHRRRERIVPQLVARASRP